MEEYTMHKFSRIESNNQSFLSNFKIPFVLVRMTENILRHSIFDAKRDMRVFLKEMGIHDYNTQSLGQKGKIIIKTHILTFKRQIETQTSLYRTETRGDERMWFGSAVLPLTCPDDIYAVFIKNSELYIINITKIDIGNCYQSSFPNPIKEWIKVY